MGKVGRARRHRCDAASACSATWRRCWTPAAAATWNASCLSGRSSTPPPCRCRRACSSWCGAGVYAGGLRANRDFLAARVAGMPLDDPLALALFDPQTSGGLLLAVAPDRHKALLDELAATGVSGWTVGEVVADPGGTIELRRDRRMADREGGAPNGTPPPEQRRPPSGSGRRAAVRPSAPEPRYRPVGAPFQPVPATRARRARPRTVSRAHV